MCQAYEGTFNGSVHIYSSSSKSTCTCSVENIGKTKIGSTITVYAVDIRLQSRDDNFGNCTDGKNSLNISDSQQDDIVLNCTVQKYWTAYDELFSSTHGKLDLTLKQNTDDGTISQMVWVIVNCKYRPRQHAWVSLTFVEKNILWWTNVVLFETILKLTWTVISYYRRQPYFF